MIAIKNISFSYGKTEILRQVSFDVQAGECVAVLGNNGAGKSTLITCLNGIRTPHMGSVHVDQMDTSRMSRLETARRIAYVAQKNEIHEMTVFEAVLLGRKPFMKWALSAHDLHLCDESLKLLGLSAFRLRYVNSLSGGELQKVMLARALVQQPRLLLLDEPTSNLDPKNQYEMMALVRQVTKERNISAIIVLHDISLALRYCDKFLFLKDGRAYRFGSEAVVTPETIEKVYGITASIAEVHNRKIAVIG